MRTLLSPPRETERTMIVSRNSSEQDIHNWGFVGTGSISATVAQEVAAAGAGRLTAVVSRDLARAQSFAERYGFTRSYDDLDALLSDPEVDAVYIALPHTLHSRAVLQALSAGKHVLCEKPLATTAEEIQSILSHPRAKDLVVAEGFMVRHHPQWRWIEEAIRSGLIGEVRVFESFFCLDARPPNPGFDLMLDIGCYAVHFARLAFQEEPLAVSAYSPSKDLVGASLYFRSGVAHIAQATHTMFGGRIHIVGSDGSLEVFSPVHSPNGIARIVVSRRGEAPQERTFGPAPQYALQFVDVSSAINTKSAARVPPANALANARCLDAIRLAAQRLSFVRL